MVIKHLKEQFVKSQLAVNQAVIWSHSIEGARTRTTIVYQLCALPSRVSFTNRNGIPPNKYKQSINWWVTITISQCDPKFPIIFNIKISWEIVIVISIFGLYPYIIFPNYIQRFPISASKSHGHHFCPESCAFLTRSSAKSFSWSEAEHRKKHAILLTKWSQKFEDLL